MAPEYLSVDRRAIIKINAFSFIDTKNNIYK